MKKEKKEKNPAKAKKVKKMIGWIVLAVIIVLVLGFSIFLYIHGNTKAYTVPANVHEAIQAQKVDKAEGDVRVMSSNLLVYYPSWHGGGSKSIGRPTDARPRAKMYFDLLETYKPDVVGLQEVCDRWYKCLMRNDLNYKLVQPAKTAFTVRLTDLMYNADTTTLLECGDFKYENGNNPRLRCVVWGLFEDKATKKQYVVTSTHFDFITSDRAGSLHTMETQMKEMVDFSNHLKETYNVPVYHTGDYNAINNVENWLELQDGYNYTEAYLEKLKEHEKAYQEEGAPSIYTELAAQLTDTKLVAKEFSGAGITNIDSPAYDHIFMNGDTEITRYVTISNQAMLQLSDHYSIFIDAKLA